MLSRGPKWRLQNLEEIAWAQAKIRYRNRFVDRIDSPRLEYLWNKRQEVEISQEEEEELYSLLFRRTTTRHSRREKK